ncbi:platelet-activating factor acetylhydrolase [Clohesyomyces aquaticus]|uniref:Putative phospholipase n=1 Tax=Clohesyomyces aquaticus TaxID=1231657 RepID=A0A1Y1ZQD6_9PLEO|nr:platelet-activating factor acetylhydrolase [Clohesyomyces aquaticus]
MAFLNKLNPTPAFPSYTGPYNVGSTDVEIPVNLLDSPTQFSTDISTVSFRVFYPCTPESHQRAVRWIPSPQREYIGAYARFLGANSAFSQLFSVLPQLLYFISIPVHTNATLLEPPTKSKKWPVMIFSHGLGGSRNSYSHIVGSLASHGMVVIAPDHRDGSSPISFINGADGKVAKPVEYRKVAHKASTEVYESRDEQLRIRLWELSLIHDALLKIDSGTPLENIHQQHAKVAHGDLFSMFSGKIAVQEPGSISFSGHSFGAATMVQFVKSAFYRASTSNETYRPLFAPGPDSSIVRQITPATPVMLLDLWCLPIQSPDTTWLKEKPMPCYTVATGGSNLLAILSEAFYKWNGNFVDTMRTIAKPVGNDPGQPGPHVFYPISSAHLSQSDFGVLFPWVTTKIFGAKEPERVLELNVRAMLQVLRNSYVEVANTSIEDLELDQEGGPHQAKIEAGISNDKKILSTKKDAVRGWMSLSTDAGPSADLPETDKSPSDAVMEGEVLGQVTSQTERGF